MSNSPVNKSFDIVLSTNAKPEFIELMLKKLEELGCQIEGPGIKVHYDESIEPKLTKLFDELLRSI